MKRWWFVIGAGALLFFVDHALAHLAIRMDAAGALLSPAGATLDAFAVAGAFLAVRLGFAAVFGAAAALAARDLARHLFGRWTRE